jgi:leader peptidase (prepilin peptidase)/N-methyltransferase
MTLMMRQSLEAVAGVPEYVGYIFAFVLGAVIGSFLNVVIHRVPNDESIVFPNSACPKCRTRIRGYDNIPVVSWLILRGRCRNCHEPISPRYPAVELLTALLFLLVYWQVGPSAFLPVALIFVSAMVALIFIDAEHMILPNVITYPLLIFAFAVRLLFGSVPGNSYGLDVGLWPFRLESLLPVWSQMFIGGLIGAVAGGGFLWVIGEGWKRLRGVEAMGLGDVKMMAAVGALLGWRLTMLSIFFGAFTGAVAGIAVILRQKDRDLQTQIPFGIFLGIGSIMTLLFGERIITWYVSNFIKY